MKVLKFGGTSVGKPESLANVINIVESATEPILVVVSALGGITDKLILTARMAAEGDKSYLDNLANIKERHFDMVEKMVLPENKKAALEKVTDLLTQLSDIYKGLSLVNELSRHSLDVVVSFGERLSSVIISASIKNARYLDSLSIMRTEKWYSKDIADTQLTNKLLIEETGVIETGKPIIMGGFIARDSSTNAITNLGRGGSDYTAAIAAAALNANVLEIWTDVDGFMTADPRIIPDAKVLDTMTFVESMELCSFGAKVVYPPTIYPVFHKNIPIKILNTFNPTAPGTLISDNKVCQEERAVVKGISSIKETAIISVSGPEIANIAEYNTRIFNSLAKHGIKVLIVSQKEPSDSISFAVNKNECEEAKEVINNEFAPELLSGDISCIDLQTETSVIAIVGENINKINNVINRFFYVLGENLIEILAYAIGVTKTTITCAVNSRQLEDALRALHKEFIR